MRNHHYPAVFLLSLSVFAASLLTAHPAAYAKKLEVGEEKPFQKIEDAVAAAKSGDEILIHPKKDGSAYLQPVILVRTAKLTFRAANPQKPVILDGEGFNYSGRGSTPRGIFQFEPGADGCVLDGLTLTNARNESNNGAGVRINQANDITVRNCVIKNNDMGIMSNGEAASKTGAGQLIEKCLITENGTAKHAGYNHNLYLGGTSVTVRECEISKSTTGHNLKSRAHINVIVNNYIHHAANREVDLVDAEGNTDIPDSDAYLVGNKIEKDPECAGNRTAVHFGTDGGAAHNGTLWLVGNTIQTPFISPVVHISAGKGAVLVKNTVTGKNGVLVKLDQPGMLAAGDDNVIHGDFTLAMPNGSSLPVTALEKAPAVPAALKTLMKK